MWGIIIGVFVTLNIVSTVIILAACVVSGRESHRSSEVVQAKMEEQMQLASAISKLRHVESMNTPVQA